MNEIAEQLAALVRAAQELEAFFATRNEALRGWSMCGRADDVTLVQLFPPRRDASDNTEAARTAARTIGGQWQRRTQEYGEAWYGSITLPSGGRATVVLHCVRVTKWDLPHLVDLDAEASR